MCSSFSLLESSCLALRTMQTSWYRRSVSCATPKLSGVLRGSPPASIEGTDTRSDRATSAC